MVNTKVSWSVVILLTLLIALFSASLLSKPGSEQLEEMKITVSQITINDAFDRTTGSCNVDFFFEVAINSSMWDDFASDSNYGSNYYSSSSQIAAAAETETGTQMGSDYNYLGSYSKSEVNIRLKYIFRGAFCFEGIHYSSWVSITPTNDFYTSGGQYLSISSYDTSSTGSATYMFYIYDY